MSNIYLKVNIETFQNFDFQRVFLSPGQFWGAPTHTDIIDFWNFLLQLKSQTSGSKTVCLFYYFNFERSYDVLKSQSPCILLNKNMNFNKNESESEVESPTHRDIIEKNLVLQLI